MNNLLTQPEPPLKQPYQTRPPRHRHSNLVMVRLTMRDNSSFRSEPCQSLLIARTSLLPYAPLDRAWSMSETAPKVEARL